MKYLVVVADDFGLCPGVNRGCLEATQNGIVTELSLMVNWPGTKDAVALAQDNNIDEVGIHLTFNNYNDTGEYLRTADYRKMLVEKTAEDLQRLAQRELNDFEQLVGRPPTHITSHQHIQQHPKLVEMIVDYAAKHDIYVRRAAAFSYEENPVGDIEKTNEKYKHFGVKFPQYFFGHIRGNHEEVKVAFMEELNEVGERSVSEIMLHPGFIDEFLTTHSSLVKERERDVKLAENKDFKQQIKKMNFEIVSFAEIDQKKLL